MKEGVLRAIFMGLALSLLLTPVARAQEKLRVATTVREYTGYYLPILAAQERGFFKEEGLEGEWVPFGGSPAMYRAVAAKEIDFGLAPVASVMLSQARGIPVIAVAELIPNDPFLIWVRSDSRFKDPRELDGTVMGVPRLGSTSHAYGQAMAKALGFKKGIKFVGAGGLTEEMAALKAGSIDSIIEPLAITIPLKMSGDIREIGSMTQFLPKEWLEHVVFATTDLIKKRPDVVRRGVRALLRGVDFIQKNPKWATDKSVSVGGYSPEASRLMYEGIQYSRDGKINRKTMEDVRSFLIEFGVIPKDKTPPVDELFTQEFTG
mgnify:CR=1 FL=1